MKTESTSMIRRLEARLRALGWKLERGRAAIDDAGDLIAEKDGRRYAATIAHSRDARRALLEALLADAILRARVAAKRRPGSLPLAVLVAPSLTSAMRARLVDYACRYARDVTACLFDLEGGMTLQGPQLRETHEASGKIPRRRAAQPLNLFSDLNRWLLKVLIARRLPPVLISAPRETLTNATELATKAGVSPMAARKLVAELRSEGFLDDDRRRLSVVRFHDLFQRWRADNLRSFLEIRARWLLRTGRDQLHETVASLHASENRVAIGLFAAASLLGLGHVQGVVPHLYVSAMDDAFLQRAQLVACQPGEPANVILRLPRWPESIFRACPLVRVAGVSKPIPVTDVVQCWLDVVDHPARGEEQAALIWDRALEPSFAEEQA